MLRLCLALCLLFAGSAAAAAAQPEIVQGADARIWQGSADSGPVTHRLSGAIFPERIGEFQRVRLASIGTDGTDVSAGYRRVQGERETVVTVYLFRPGALPEHRLRGSIAAIGIRSPEAFFWSAGPFLTGSSPDLRARKLVFKTGIGPNTVLDYLYFAPLGQWTVKVRATLPSSQEVDDERAIDALVRGLPWTAILAANGPCNGRACGLDGADPFDSHFAEMMLPGRDDARAIYEHRGYRLVAWPDALARLFTEAYGIMSVRTPIHTIERRRDGRWRIERLFSGLPSEATFRAEVENLTRYPEQSPFLPAARIAEALPGDDG